MVNSSAIPPRAPSKVYESQEEVEMRFFKWVENLALVESHNAEVRVGLVVARPSQADTKSYSLLSSPVGGKRSTSR